MKLLIVLSVLLLSGCAIGAGTSGYALRAKTASELTSEAEDRLIQKSVKETVEYLSRKRLINTTEAPVVESAGTTGPESGL